MEKPLKQMSHPALRNIFTTSEESAFRISRAVRTRSLVLDGGKENLFITWSNSSSAAESVMARKYTIQPSSLSWLKR